MMRLLPSGSPAFSIKNPCHRIKYSISVPRTGCQDRSALSTDRTLPSVPADHFNLFLLLRT